MRKIVNMVTPATAVVCAGVLLTGCAHGGEHGAASAQAKDVAMKTAAMDSAAATVDTAVDSKYAKPGFYTELDKNGRLWVFRAGSEGLATFKEHGEPAKIAIRPAAGPGGITLKSIDSETIVEYITAKPGFATELDENGRLWVFRAGSEGLANFKQGIEPAKHVIRPAAGPMGLTLKALDSETIVAYLTAKPGFATELDENGRLWVFRAGSEGLANFKQGIEPAKHVIRPAAGPMGLTLKALEPDVLDAYLAAKE